VDLALFLLVTLFAFFWVETFFARNIADVRPLFQWMPILMIFLVAALTMRQWSEEQKMGTLEVLLTLPVSLAKLVAGKFFAVLALVAAALFLTAGLPVSVAMLGALDWGPVIGGYLGALLMAAAYIAMGLFVSSRSAELNHFSTMLRHKNPVSLTNSPPNTKCGEPSSVSILP